MNSRSIPAEWLPQYSYSDYEQWEGDWELIYGFPYAMSPSPKRVHQFSERKFLRLVEDALSEKRDCDCMVYHELDWIIDDNTVVCPDIMIVCGKFEDDFLRFPPTLIVEIASSKTRLKDRNVKFKLYEANGVKFYLIADPDKQSTDVFILKDNYYQQTNTSSFQITNSCTIELALDQLW